MYCYFVFLAGATNPFALFVIKINRYDMSKPMEFYWGDMARTLDHMKKCAKSNKFSCQHEPLIDIPLQNVVLDEFLFTVCHHVG